jgi:hypothetical protein
MLQDLAALAPPAIVCAAFLVGAWVIVRRELAPKRRQRANAKRQQAPGSREEGGRPEGSPEEGGPQEGGAAAGNPGKGGGRVPAGAEQQRRS